MTRARAGERAAVAVAAEGFLAEMAALMGLPADAAQALREPAGFRGLAGFRCRLRLLNDHRGAAAIAVRPQVLLPVAARDLAGPELERLLALQEAMLMELGWVVGIGPEGLLQLSPIAAIAEPGAAVVAVDLGQVLARDALDELVGRQHADEAAPHPRARPRSRRGARMRSPAPDSASR